MRLAVQTAGVAAVQVSLLVNTALVSSVTYDLLLTNNTATLQTMVTK